MIAREVEHDETFDIKLGSQISGLESGKRAVLMGTQPAIVTAAVLLRHLRAMSQGSLSSY